MRFARFFLFFFLKKSEFEVDLNVFDLKSHKSIWKCGNGCVCWFYGEWVTEVWLTPFFSVEAGDTDFVKPSEGSKTISLTIDEVNDNADELVELVSRW